jgi:transcriptional regulator
MYIPKSNREDDPATLANFMQANSFATLVSVLDGVPYATHLPLILTLAADVITLTGHLAKANPHCAALDSGEALAIFSGPHAYISPAHYEAQESVPTWNYIAVHAYGRPATVRASDDSAALERMLAAMIATYEPAYQAQWQALSPRYRAGMLQGIVGFELVVTRLEGKYKLSQNRSLRDQQQVMQGLDASADPAARATATAMADQLRQRA